MTEQIKETALRVVSGVPDGWKPVPIDPTVEQINAAHEAGFFRQIAIPMYDAMISAAPATPADAVAKDAERQRDALNHLCEFNERTMSDLLKQRDELLAALGLAQATMNCAGMDTPRIVAKTVEKYADAIARVKGGAA